MAPQLIENKTWPGAHYITQAFVSISCINRHMYLSLVSSVCDAKEECHNF